MNNVYIYTLMLTELTKYNALCENVYVLVIKNAASI